jgi:DNA polymerase-3 subunit delta'
MPFATIVGHERIVAILRRTLESQRIAHAYLFVGPEGCGKRTTALTLIEAAFCNGIDGCGSCPTCRRLAALQHPDLHLLGPDGAFIKIDQVRQLQRELSLRPYEAPFKACIIESVDRFHPSAGNALLKTLEEPPGSALMILLTSNPEAVLPTIRSRCQSVNFQHLPEESVALLLARQGADPAAARLAACLAGGSPGRAMELCSEGALNGRQEIIEQFFSQSVRDIGTLFNASERLAAEKEGLPQILDLLTTFLRDILLLRVGSNELVNRDLADLVEREAERHPPELVMELLDHVRTARQALQRNVNARLALDVLLMRLAA